MSEEKTYIEHLKTKVEKLEQLVSIITGEKDDLEEEVSILKESLSEKNRDIELLKNDLREARDELYDSEQNQKAENTVEIPYLRNIDQLKADQIVEHWEKITLSDVDKMIDNLQR